MVSCTLQSDCKYAVEFTILPQHFMESLVSFTGALHILPKMQYFKEHMFEILKDHLWFLEGLYF